MLFGYFCTRRRRHRPGARLTVFTCLSHDIIAHETTHAILDGMHRRFNEPSNPDVLAFHEAFADLVALFQHFSLPNVLRHQIAATRGDLASQNRLGELAQQFGQAIGKRGALRSAIGQVDEKTGEWTPATPDPDAYRRDMEPHTRGALLVAAVFDAFLRCKNNQPVCCGSRPTALVCCLPVSSTRISSTVSPTKRPAPHGGCSTCAFAGSTTVRPSTSRSATTCARC